MSHGAKKQHPKLAITIGDINGIGPEIIIKAFREDRFLNLCTPIIYGSAPAMIFYKKLLQNKGFIFQTIQHPDEAHPKKINLVNAWEEDIKIQVGEPTPAAGKAAFRALSLAMEHINSGALEILVTAPIHKKSTQQGGMNFPGHTEYLAHACNTDQQLMVLVGERLKVAVVSGHVPLANVQADISKKKVLKAIKALHRSLLEDFGCNGPRIAVLGLNPHAGEGGTLGTEEQDSLAPAMEEAARHGITALGPYPADGFFGTGLYKNFDAVLAMYHDQGLVPFKLLEFENGVNFTAGLPIVRTSPDHGTAFSIAGKDQASDQSMVEAIYLALKVYHNRLEYKESNANPLGTKVERQKDRE
ncbi:MAG: 4-hydroxythreonine-4-phosphate dehydrogenase PdxA [Bacteroidetes bacterium]|jgi:4-hydroxythreonine-4-phosphate dehydrogenase|nr:4-hydroxythreonine-4-phosphate dehydrogenase PdxA [Bacteroidota bacterium]